MNNCRIDLKHTKNTRTLSLLSNKEGKKIKPHLLLRSDALNEIDEMDLSILKKEYQLKRVIDLRCDNEVLDKPDKLSSDIALVLNPILPSKTVGMTKTGDAKRDLIDFIESLQRQGLESSEAFMEHIYEEVVTSEFSQKAYATFLNLLLNPISGSTLWHCSAGKDRAGFATILILSALDFSKEVIIEDYLLTNLFYQDTIDKMKQLLGDHYEAVLKSAFGVKKEFIDTIYQVIDTVYGGMDQYLCRLGIDQVKKEELKRIYLMG